MGKRIISQRRGRGSPTYRVPSYKFRPRIAYRDSPGVVVDIVSDPARNAPLAYVKYSDGTEGYIVASEGMRVGDSTEELVLPLSRIDEGARFFAIETKPNSGPKLCRTPGSSALLVSKTKNQCIIQLPSKKKMGLNPQCRATVGQPAGEGRREKPWVKAGKKWIAMHRRGKLYPRTSAVAMNAVDHPFGGGGKGKVRPPVSRDAPPGRKVGSIAPSRTGKRKK